MHYVILDEVEFVPLRPLRADSKADSIYSDEPQPVLLSGGRGDWSGHTCRQTHAMVGWMLAGVWSGKRGWREAEGRGGI